MSLQQKTFVETLKEKLTVGTKVYVTSAGVKRGLFSQRLLLKEGIIQRVDWDGFEVNVKVEFQELPRPRMLTETSFVNGWIATYEMLSPSDKTLLWSMSPDESYVDEEGDFNRYAWDEQEEIERIRSLPDDENLVNDVVKSPKHYRLFEEFGLEIKDVNKRILDNIEKSDFDMTLYEAGWLQQALQYQMRAHEKNGLEDYKKAIQTLQFVVDSMEERNNDK